MVLPIQLSSFPGMFLVAGLRGDDVLSWTLYLSAVVIVALGGFFWAAFVRKSKTRRRRIHRPHTWELEPGEEQDSRHSRRSSRRRTRHKKPVVNPTLAEAGGLPPVRKDEATEPPDPAN